MKRRLLSIALLTLLTSPAFAEKPEWAGKGKPTAEQKAAHKAAMNAKIGDDDSNGEKEDRYKKEKAKKQKEMKQDALAKLKGKKSEQERKEIDKGSDEGREAREANTKKWWRFWGDE